MKQPINLAALALGAVLLAYTAARAALLSFTHDEALTWLFYVQAPLSQTLGFGGAIPTNNHLLNTFLAKLTAALFGPSELALRLPNLFAHAAYLFFSWRLLQRFVAPNAALVGFVLLNTQPFLLDFFSLCRGYGLSLGLLMAALDSLADPERETRGFFFLGLGCLASFSLIYAWAGVTLALLVVRRRLRWSSIAVGVSTLAVVFMAVWKLRRDLEFGGVDGFWRDTVGSLVPCLVYNVHGGIWLAGSAVAAAIAVWLPPSQARRSDLAPLFAVAVSGSALAEVTTHLFFKMRFLTDRMASFYVPLALLAALFALERTPRLQRAFAVGVAVLSLTHLGLAFNLRTTYLWAYDAGNKQVIAELPRQPLRLGCTWVFSPSLEYYRLSRGLDWLAPMVRGSPFGDYDFVYVTPDDRPEAERRGLTRVKDYGQNTLYRDARLNP